MRLPARDPFWPDTLKYAEAYTIVTDALARHLGTPAEDLRDETSLDSLAVDSVDIVEVATGIEEVVGVSLDAAFGTVDDSERTIGWLVDCVLAATQK